GENPVYWSILAEYPDPKEDGQCKVVGFALYYIRYSTWKEQRMFLEDLIVTEKMRGKNAGQLLFDALIKEAKEKKLTGITWQVLNWNEPAINFYKKIPDVSFDGEWINCSINL